MADEKLTLLTNGKVVFDGRVTVLHENWSIGVPKGFYYSTDKNKNGQSITNPDGVYDLIMAGTRKGEDPIFSSPYENMVSFVTCEAGNPDYINIIRIFSDLAEVKHGNGLTVYCGEIEKIVNIPGAEHITTYKGVVAQADYIRVCQIQIGGNFAKADKAEFARQVMASVKSAECRSSAGADSHSPGTKSSGGKDLEAKLREAVNQRKAAAQKRAKEAEEAKRKAEREAAQRKAAAEKRAADEKRKLEEKRDKKKADAKRHMESVTAECKKNVNDFKDALDKEIEKRIKETVKQNKKKVKELNDCLKEKEKQLSALGFFKISEKHTLKKEIEEIQAETARLSDEKLIADKKDLLQKRADEALKSYSNIVDTHLADRFDFGRRRQAEFDKMEKSLIRDECYMLMYIEDHPKNTQYRDIYPEMQKINYKMWQNTFYPAWELNRGGYMKCYDILHKEKKFDPSDSYEDRSWYYFEITPEGREFLYKTLNLTGLNEYSENPKMEKSSIPKMPNISAALEEKEEPAEAAAPVKK